VTSSVDAGRNARRMSRARAYRGRMSISRFFPLLLGVFYVRDRTG
jgi:hypothetical protein